MATITFDQATLSPAGVTNRSRSDGLINGSEVTITVSEPGTVAFVDVPEGDTNSVSSLQQVSPLVWKFTPTAGVYGSWLVEFKPTAVANQPVRRIFAVRSPSKALRIPAFNEHASSKATVLNGSSLVDSSDNNEGGSYRGWAPALAELYKTVVSATTVLTTNLTVYVNSAAGNDTNAGTQVAPFKTLQRAFTERGSYIVRDCVFTVQLVGAGPYPIPSVVGGWLHYGRGSTAIRGDVAAQIIATTGTTTSVIANANAPTFSVASGLGNDTHAGKFLRFTSGANVGQILQIAEHTDTSVSLVFGPQFALTIGDTFQIFTPGSELQGTATFVGVRNADGFSGWASLVLENLRWATGGYCLFDKGSVLVLCVDYAGQLWMQDAHLDAKLVDASFLGDAVPSKYRCGALFRAAFNVWGASYAQGIYVVLGATDIEQSATGFFQMGGRFGQVTVATGGTFVVLAGNGSSTILRSTVIVQDGGIATLDKSSQSIGKHAVTSGDCIRATTGGLVRIARPLTGGTTDAAGYAVNVTGGGRCYFSGNAPITTGGTGGKDLKTSNNGGVANAVLTAAGTAAGNATDALLGEVLARI